MERHVETEIATMWLKNGILFFIWKEHAHIDLPRAKTVVASRIRLQQGKPSPILCSLKGLKHVEKDAWRYLASEGTELVEVLALVATTPLERAFSKFIMSKMPTVPVSIFADLHEAEQFLLHDG